jgi:peptide deformylase
MTQLEGHASHQLSQPEQHHNSETALLLTNQPTKDLTEGVGLAQVQVDIPQSVYPILCFTASLDLVRDT